MMKSLRNRSAILSILIAMMAGIGCGAQTTTSSDAQGVSPGTSPQKEPGDGDNKDKPKRCDSRKDCDPTTEICSENVCKKLDTLTNLCEDSNFHCGEKQRCENNRCVADCDSTEMCGGVCCGSGTTCYKSINKCVPTTCNAGQEICGTIDAPVCCAAGEGCFAGKCAKLHSPCDNETSFCALTNYCDSHYTSCVRYDDNPGLCLYETTKKFAPTLKLNWTGGSDPSHNVMMTPMVADVTGDDIPDIVFSTFEVGNGMHYKTRGILRVISGKAGAKPEDVTVHWTSRDDTLAEKFWVNGTANPAIGDVVKTNPGLEIIAVSRQEKTQDKDRVIALDGKTGKILWKSFDGSIQPDPDNPNAQAPPLPRDQWASVALADLDHDGQPEVLYNNYVFDGATGRLLCKYGTNDYTPVAIDLDGQGNMELIQGGWIFTYERNGDTATCTQKPVPAGTPDLSSGEAAVADMDNDGHPDIIVVKNHQVYRLNQDGGLIWQTKLTGSHFGGAPTIADFDGDGELEVAFSNKSDYTVIETDGSTMWTHTVHEGSSGRTGSSVFDFNGDGKAEVVYSDEQFLYIFDGSNGDSLIEIKKDDGTVANTLPGSSGTATENPIIVDVDNDGHAEIVLPSNNYHVHTITGIQVYGDKKWVNTRKIWNQHAYHYTNVNDDGTIPTHEVQHWTQEWSNNYRQNVQKGNVRLAPNLQVTLDSVFGLDCSATATTTRPIAYSIHNVGDSAVAAGTVTTVVYARETGTSDYVEIDSRTNTTEISAKGSEKVTFTWTIPDALKTRSLDFKVVTNGDGAVSECKSDDNTVERTGVEQTPPNLLAAITSIDMANCANGMVTVRFEVLNKAIGLAKAGVKINVYAGLENASQLIGTVTTTKDLAQNDSESFSVEWQDTIPINQNLEVILYVDETNEVAECLDADNKVQPTVAPVCFRYL